MEFFKELEFVKKSVDNEAELENYFYKCLKLEPKEYGYFPKIARVKNVESYIFRMAAKLIWISWPFIQYIYFFLLFCRFSVATIINKKNVIDSDSKILFFASSELATGLFVKAKGLRPLTISRPSLVECSTGSNISVLSNLNFSDLCMILMKSVTYTSIICLTRDSRWKLLTYWIYELLACKKAIENVLKMNEIHELCITDHFDRWALMGDSIAYNFPKVNFCIIQHGILTTIGKDGVEFPFKLPNKINNLDSLYCFDQSSEIIFKDQIINNRKTVHVSYFKNNLNIVETHSEQKTLLFIGHPLCIQFHAELAREIAKEKKLQVIYKPHPTQVVNRKKYASLWLIYGSKVDFPKADIIISYPSTLADQYKEYGFNVLIHELYAGTDSDRLKILNNVTTLIHD